MTPLLWAATADYGSADIVRLLLASGANPNGKDKSGASPVDLAKRNGFSYLARVLEAAQTAQAH
jgi:ankyrin repeat protein